MSKQSIYLEHANITVNDLEAAIHFFQTAFPHFVIRGGGNDLREWVHLGDDFTYLALNRATDETPDAQNDYDRAGINHIGFVVEDVEEISKNLLAAGYPRSYPKQNEQYRIRDYFNDKEGNQYEFVQYLSDKVEQRNQY